MQKFLTKRDFVAFLHIVVPVIVAFILAYYINEHCLTEMP
jgi:hypothetical protein